ncbi:MAG: Fpg/Nei family DNA glycosylase [Luteitalea sp.]|nr:Fpg/Nei family DNA glycosylase [Acidobacteriota bacterium]
MPEGDTIFRAARTLDRALAGQVVTRFETQYAQIARVHDDAPITGRTVEQVEARGKHLLMFFSAPRAEAAIAGAGPVILRTHMMMSGSWHIYRIGEPWQRSPTGARLVVGTAGYVAVGFNVPVAEFIERDELETSEAIGRLGPDVLGVEFDVSDAAAKLARSDRGTAADALLDQRAVAGIGNVYKSELLFLARLWPFLPPDRVSSEQWARIARDARTLLRANVVDPTEAGVFTYRGNRRTTGRANPGQSLYVYGRHRQPCRRCGTAILMRHHGEHNRSTYWCPTCQLTDA